MAMFSHIPPGEWQRMADELNRNGRCDDQPFTRGAEENLPEIEAELRKFGYEGGKVLLVSDENGDTSLRDLARLGGTHGAKKGGR